LEPILGLGEASLDLTPGPPAGCETHPAVDQDGRQGVGAGGLGISQGDHLSGRVLGRCVSGRRTCCRPTVRRKVQVGPAQGQPGNGVALELLGQRTTVVRHLRGEERPDLLVINSLPLGVLILTVEDAEIGVAPERPGVARERAGEH
jgi:hypothetical protein